MLFSQDPSLPEFKDFTTATEWEKFIASLEQLIEEWRLPNIVSTGPLTNVSSRQQRGICHGLRRREFSESVRFQGALAASEWKSRTESVSFANFKMLVTRHYLEGSTKERSEEDQAKEALEETEECEFTEL